MTVVLPAMTEPQTQAWLGLLEVSRSLRSGWCLVGGQLVHLHCAERGVAPNRPTDDGDAALDVRGHPAILETFTTALRNAGFDSAGASPGGHQHRWIRGSASIDVLIPRGVGPRAAARRGATGGTTVEAPGAQQALDRTEGVEVQLGDVRGLIPRPNLHGSLVAKAAAYTILVDTYRERHLIDFAVLASMVARADRIGEQLSKRDSQYLAPILATLDVKRGLWAGIEGAERGLDVLTDIVARSNFVGTRARSSSQNPARDS